jgi:hypothetical protein
MLTLARVALAAVVILIGCKQTPAPGALDQRSDFRAPSTRVPVVRALDLSDASADTVLQTIVDASDTEVTFSACDDWLSKRVSIHTSEPKIVPVIVAMIVTQTGAAASLDDNRWTLYCREAEGPGRLFRNGRPPERVTVPKEPESPK